MLYFPIVLEDNDGTVLATSPDFPELTTFGDDRDEALARAVGALEEAVAARIHDGRDVPSPSGGEVRAALPTLTAIKVILYQGIGSKASARRSGPGASDGVRRGWTGGWTRGIAPGSMEWTPRRGPSVGVCRWARRTPPKRPDRRTAGSALPRAYHRTTGGRRGEDGIDDADGSRNGFGPARGAAQAPHRHPDLPPSRWSAPRRPAVRRTARRVRRSTTGSSGDRRRR